MPRLIKISDHSIESKVAFICNLHGWNLSPSELALLVRIVRSGVMGLNMDHDTAQALIEGTGITISSFNVVLSRLAAKGCINKNGRVVNVHPQLFDLDKHDEYVIRFIPGPSGT